MTEKSKNFRSTYYDKVGFRGAEEKKALQNLINEKPMDKDKMSKFCLKFSLLPMYREYVWKVLLDIVPTYSECHESIMKQRNLHYEDLENALKVMQKINENTAKSIVHTLMYLMTNETLEYNMEEQMSEEHVQNLISLASLFTQLSSSDVISYFLFRNFMLHQKKLCYNFRMLIENVEAILKKEDESVYEFLKNLNAFEQLPFSSWFERCFAGVLHQNSVEKICDKIIGGSYKILPYIAAAMLLFRKNSFLSLTQIDKITELLKKNSEEKSDIIVNTAIDLCYS